jgi:hypothetical protein
LLQCKKWGSSVMLLVNVGSQWKNFGNEFFSPWITFIFVPPMHILYKVIVVQNSSNKNKIHSFFIHVSCPSYSLIVLRAILSIFPWQSGRLLLLINPKVWHSRLLKL